MDTTASVFREQVSTPVNLPSDEINAQVERILGSSPLVKSPQLARFLRYCVATTLARKLEQLRENVLATEVFRRPEGFDSRRDPIVRVEARRLRSKLEEYYSAEGRLDPIVISLQRGEYVARFARARVGGPVREPSAPTRVLIVEDERVVARDLETRLRSMNYLVVGQAATGESAVAQAEQLRPDIVLMDIVLAGKMSGTEAARLIWQSSRTPIVYLTAFSDAVVLADIKDSESYGYILKPFEPRQVHAVLQLALSRQAREAAATAVKPNAETLTGVLQNLGIRIWDWEIPTDAAEPWPRHVIDRSDALLPGNGLSAELFLDHVSTADRGRVSSEFAAAILTQGRVEVHYTVTAPSGESTPALALGAAFDASDGTKHVGGIELCFTVPSLSAEG